MKSVKRDIVNIDWNITFGETVLTDAVIENEFYDSLTEVDCDDLTDPSLRGCYNGIWLVRDVYNDEEGLIDRVWAKVINGLLPDYFDDSNIRVPLKHREELTAFVDRFTEWHKQKSL